MGIRPFPAVSDLQEKRSLVHGTRQTVARFLLLGLLLAVAGCSYNPLDALNPFKEKEDESQRGIIGFVQGFFGGVVTDEPRAAVIGREILSAGGSAADGAVAVSLALSMIALLSSRFQ